MPYIKQEDRIRVINDPYDTRSAGELNFAISRLVNLYVARNGKSYKTLNEVVGALECAKMELYRRVISPYEDNKIIENGDVYDIS